jgi:hypothetical protein
VAEEDSFEVFEVLLVGKEVWKEQISNVNIQVGTYIGRNVMLMYHSLNYPLPVTQ